MHEDPQVPNYGRKGSGKVLKDGIVLAIEPMINLGTHEVIFHKAVSYTHLDVYKRQGQDFSSTQIISIVQFHDSFSFAFPIPCTLACLNAH